MKEQDYKTLAGAALFRGISEEELKEVLQRTESRVQTYERGEFVFSEEDVPDRLLILLEGSLIVAKDTMNGKRTILTNIDEPGDLFGEIYPFIGLPHYEMYVEALAPSRVLSIDASIMHSGGDDRIRYNLMTIFAQKAYRMNQRLRILGASGIRGKIARLLVRQQHGKLRVHTMSREAMADYLNVTRPSLSRELGNMANEGILELDGRDIIILDQDALEEYI